ncbi:MAG TPA: hypothetical protein VG960_06010 [Caulobacteraceae bacterium]|nr:hypothetical protein [Caulobacteraceae bacterium]
MFCFVMTVAAQTPPQPTTTNAPAPDLARALLERQLWVLGQLAEGGLEIARAIERRATSDESPDAVLDAAPMAYARVSRAVRMTILLQSKLIADLQTLEVKGAQAAANANSLLGTQRVGLECDQKDRIGRIIARIAGADGADEDEVERLAEEAAERLDQDDLYGDVLTRPVSELVAQICKDLGLEPNWPQLAEEAWAKADLNTGVAAAPLAAVVAEHAQTRPPPASGVVQFTPHAASP